MAYANQSTSVAEARKIDRMTRAKRAFDVPYWCVVEDRQIGNRKLIGCALSRKFATRTECRREFARIKGANPWAYISQADAILNPGRPADVENRKIILDVDEMRGLAA